MNIAVFGATGTLGSLIVQQATMLDHTVTALVRNPQKLKHQPAQIITGDALDPAAVDNAVRGQHAVIYALGSPSRPDFFAATTRILIEAMQRHNIPRLIAITGIGAGDSKGHGGWLYDNIIYPLFTKKMYADKDVQEQIIRSSNLDWIIVRPASFTNGPLGGTLRATDKLEGVTISSISRQDAAAFTLDQLSSNLWLRKSPLVGY